MYYVRENGRTLPITSVRIRSLIDDRRRDGVTVAEQALAMGIGRSTLNNYRYGYVPGADIITRLCLYYGVSADWILGMDAERALAKKLGRGA